MCGDDEVALDVRQWDLPWRTDNLVDARTPCETHDHGQDAPPLSRHDLRPHSCLCSRSGLRVLGHAECWGVIAAGVTAISLSLVRLRVILDRCRARVDPRLL